MLETFCSARNSRNSIFRNAPGSVVIRLAKSSSFIKGSTSLSLLVWYSGSVRVRHSGSPNGASIKTVQPWNFSGYFAKRLRSPR